MARNIFLEMHQKSVVSKTAKCKSDNNKAHFRNEIRNANNIRQATNYVYVVLCVRVRVFVCVCAGNMRRYNLIIRRIRWIVSDLSEWLG